MCWQLRTHPNIVGIKASFNGDPNYFYLVQELMTGGELFDSIVKQKHYTEHKARNIAAQLMDAIAYMHRAGIIHRDLKPENVLLTDASENARVKIADFGLSCSVNTVSSIHMLSACGTAAYVLLWCAVLRCGVCLLVVRLFTSTIVWSRACTRRYAAPEVLDRNGYSGARDIWSMGIIIYIMLSGHPPFFSTNKYELYRLIRECKLTFAEPVWAKVSDEAKDLIRKCMAVDPAQRLTAEQALQHEWMRSTHIPSRDLPEAMLDLRKFNNLRRLRAVVNTIMYAAVCFAAAPATVTAVCGRCVAVAIVVTVCLAVAVPGGVWLWLWVWLWCGCGSSSRVCRV